MGCVVLGGFLISFLVGVEFVAVRKTQVVWCFCVVVVVSFRSRSMWRR